MNPELFMITFIFIFRVVFKLEFFKMMFVRVHFSSVVDHDFLQSNLNFAQREAPFLETPQNT
jgi:hypothetical protein